MLADDARGTLRAAARAIRALATSRQGGPAVSSPSSTVEANRNPGSNSTPQREDGGCPTGECGGGVVCTGCRIDHEIAKATPPEPQREFCTKCGAEGAEPHRGECLPPAAPPQREDGEPDPAAPCLACGARRDEHPRFGTPYACETMGFQEPPVYRCENSRCDWKAYRKPCERRCPRCGATVWKGAALSHAKESDHE